MHNRIPRGLIALLLLGLITPLAAAQNVQSPKRVPQDFEYPPSPEIIEIENPITARSLSGVVRDPNGATLDAVLVEQVRRTGHKRIAAAFTDASGRFALPRTTPGIHFLRLSKPGFDTMLMRVKVRPKVRWGLKIQLQLSK